MSKNNKRDRKESNTAASVSPGRSGHSGSRTTIAAGDWHRPRIENWFSYLKTHWAAVGSVAIVLLLGLGVMAENGWLPSTDPLSGKKTGWFGMELPKNAASSWNPLAAPLPPPTTALSKEYVYAGSRLLAVEDANANAAPPADLAIWRPSTGTWWVMGSQGSQQTIQSWGINFDIPVPGDYDGDGKTDTAIFRPSSGTWYINRTSDGGTTIQQFGLSTDTPAPADYDGDGRSDIAVWRSTNTTFYSSNSSNGATQTVGMSTSSTEPVSADYDGDGKANYAVKSGANWVIMNAARTATTTTVWQSSTDKPVQNDYDGDGKVDIAVWRPSNGNWYIRQSAFGNSLRQVQWGQSGDIPVPAFYRR